MRYYRGNRFLNNESQHNYFKFIMYGNRILMYPTSFWTSSSILNTLPFHSRHQHSLNNLAHFEACNIYIWCKNTKKYKKPYFVASIKNKQEIIRIMLGTFEFQSTPSYKNKLDIFDCSFLKFLYR